MKKVMRKQKTFEFVLDCDWTGKLQYGSSGGLFLCAKAICALYPDIRRKKRIWITISDKPGKGFHRCEVKQSGELKVDPSFEKLNTYLIYNVRTAIVDAGCDVSKFYVKVEY